MYLERISLFLRCETCLLSMPLPSTSCPRIASKFNPTSYTIHHASQLLNRRHTNSLKISNSLLLHMVLLPFVMRGRWHMCAHMCPLARGRGRKEHPVEKILLNILFVQLTKRKTRPITRISLCFRCETHILNVHLPFPQMRALRACLPFSSSKIEQLTDSI
jgi:hypothetical protein